MEDFEIWLRKCRRQIDKTALMLFEDSLRCFKHDIDRPAYLLAYQGMIMHLKMVILKGKRPSEFPEGQWDNYLAGLRHDHSWDANTYDRIVQTAKIDGADPTKNRPAVLVMDDEVRSKFPFFRDIRNVCAHYKEYNFIKAHTLVLYSFIAQYLLTISVEGGLASLLKEFKDFFDPSLTSPNDSVNHLVDKIPLMVLPQEFDFLMHGISQYTGFYYRKEFIEILHLIIHTSTDEFKQRANQYIHSNENLENNYIDTYPESILTLIMDSKEIRRYWYERIISAHEQLEILCHLIEAKRIPQNDRNEAFKHILDYGYKNNQSYDIPPERCIYTLKDAGFYQAFIDYYYNERYAMSNYREICYKTDSYMSIISQMPINKEFVETTCDIYRSSYPYTLKDRFIREMYIKDSEFQKSFDKVANEHTIDIPDNLFKK